MCGEAVIDITKLPKEIQEKVYKPEPGEVYNVDIDLTKGKETIVTSGEEVAEETSEIE